MVELSDKDFKAVIIKMLQQVKTLKANRLCQQRNRKYQ